MECGQLTGPCSSGSTHSRCLTSTWRKPRLAARMATIRDVVEALSRSNGVDAVLVVGRDGLPIDSRVANGVDAESVAALLPSRSEEHTSELQSRENLVCRLLLEKKKKKKII